MVQLLDIYQNCAFVIHHHAIVSACANSNQLVVPSVRLKTFGGRRFGVVGPAIWNSLPDYLKDPDISFDTFRKYLKTYMYLFAHY